jgi:hypothetical protein
MYLTSGIWSMIKSSQVEDDVRISLTNSASFYETNRVYNSSWNVLHARVSIGPCPPEIIRGLLSLGYFLIPNINFKKENLKKVHFSCPKDILLLLNYVR